MNNQVENIPSGVRQHCQTQKLGDVVSAAPLKGGIQSLVRRLQTASGLSMILKQHPQAPADWYPLEAEGLKLLDLPNCVRVPKIYGVCSEYLLLEDLSGSTPVQVGPSYWQEFGYQLAQLHLHTQSQYGFTHDNYLGLKPQKNPLMDDGHEFFIQNRVLYYLNQPLSLKTLTREDRIGVERLCEWIRKNVPLQPASLLHGDLWTGNMVIGSDGAPAYIDPAVHYGWAEAELSLTRQFGGVPDSFYDAYNEVNPLESGWSERLPIYELKEDLALIAQFGDAFEMVGPLREIIALYR